jgi:hypothetical protein
MIWDALLMQGEERMDRGSSWTLPRWPANLVPGNSMFAFLAVHRGDLFPDEDFADLLRSERGRPSVPAPVMAAAITLHDYSDRETAARPEAVAR